MSALLPAGWTNIHLKDICELLNGRAYKQDELLKSGKYPVLRVGNFFSNKNWYYSDLELEQDKYCDNGDLLYAWSASFGPRIWDGGKVIYHYHIWRTQPNEGFVIKRFLYHWFEWDKENIKAEHGTGSTMIHVTKGDMEGRSLYLPPFAEQQRIVAKVDSVSAIAKRARDHLDHIPRLVEKYKQAILAAAFRGELTQSWRTLHGRQFAYPLTLISALADVVTGFTPPTKNRARYFGGNVAFFKPTDLNAGYQVVEPRETLTEEGAAVGRKLPKHSTLVTCIGATIGKTGFARVECCTNQQINGLVPHRELVIPEWLYWMVISQDFQQSINDNASATTLPIINKGRFLNLSLPRPPLEEQREVVRLVEKSFAWIDRLVSETTSARTLVDHLDQAILAKAFRGELVPQDPNDEPASVLLERIKAERRATAQLGPKREKVSSRSADRSRSRT